MDMKAVFNYKNKRIEIENIKRCKGINQGIGLMFKKRNVNALLFEFKTPSCEAIHSLFCNPFLAIWLDENNKIVDTKFIDKLGVYKPKKNFSKLLEVPLNKNYNSIIQFFLDFESLNK